MKYPVAKRDFPRKGHDYLGFMQVRADIIQ